MLQYIDYKMPYALLIAVYYAVIFCMGLMLWHIKI